MDHILTYKEILGAILAMITAIILMKKAYIELKSTLDRSKKTTDKEGIKINDTSSSNVSNSGNSIINNNIINLKNDSNSVDNSDDKSEVSSLNSRHVRLKEVYTSLFAENETLKSEAIIITEFDHDRIKGKVKLDEQDTYDLIGTFNNNILTGEYFSIGAHKDERGTINLKLISDDILSGFCSFSKVSMENDQIRVSPYIWVSDENADLINGTYEFCTKCHDENKICCCASEDIDMPILLATEADAIRAISTKTERLKEFSNLIAKSSIRQMKRSTSEITNEANGKCFSPCYFYSYKNRSCKIYDKRPVDCRLFPFDIKLDTNTNEYFVGYYPDLCDRKLPEMQSMKKYVHILRPYFFLLYPFAHLITNDQVCEKLKNARFEKLYKLRDFIF